MFYYIISCFLFVYFYFFKLCMFRSSYTCWWSIACIGLCMFVTQLFKIVSSCFRSVSIFLGLRGWSEWEVGHARPMLKISFHQPLVHWITLRNSVFPFLCEDFLRSLNIKKKQTFLTKPPQTETNLTRRSYGAVPFHAPWKGTWYATSSV